MSYHIFLDHTEPEDLASKNSRANMKKFIKKTLAKNENHAEALESIKDEIADRYFAKKEGHDNTVSIKLDEEKKEIRIYFDRELDIVEYNEMKAQQRRKELKQRLRQKIASKKNVMTDMQYIKKMKAEKKIMNKDERVTDEMKKKYMLLKGTVPGAQFPNPVEMLNDKEKHMNNFYQYIITTKNYFKDNEEKFVEMCNNDYVNYVACVFDFKPEILIKSIIRVHEAREKSKTSEEKQKQSTIPEVDEENEDDSDDDDAPVFNAQTASN